MSAVSLKCTFIKSVLSGILIGIGGTVYLCIDNKYMGALLFSLGLFTIIQFGFSLFTGKVGYIPENKPCYVFEVAVTFLGNALGTAVCALLMRQTRTGDLIYDKALSAVSIKTEDSFISQLILAFFCGMLMYIAVENAGKCREKALDFSAVFGICFPVMVFIFCGFNHSVADCFYIFASKPELSHVLYILTAVFGNALGGMFIPLMKKLYTEK